MLADDASLGVPSISVGVLADFYNESASSSPMQVEISCDAVCRDVRNFDERKVTIVSEDYPSSQNRYNATRKQYKPNTTASTKQSTRRIEIIVHSNRILSTSVHIIEPPDIVHPHLIRSTSRFSERRSLLGWNGAVHVLDQLVVLSDERVGED